VAAAFTFYFYVKGQVDSFSHPSLLYLVMILLLLWAFRFWRLVSRCGMGGDLMRFVLRDGFSWGIVCISAALLILAGPGV
jgi:hypothetical protein